MQREITEIIIHCSDTRVGADFRANDIDRWHKQKGWICIGYHYVVDLSGFIELGRDESLVGAHCTGHNRHSIGICYIGGQDLKGRHADTRTPEQKKALKFLLDYLKLKYPKATIHGHHEFNSSKACPCFDVSEYR